jgi:hypothetical protein
VGLPDHPSVSGLSEFSRHVFELPVEPDHFDPLLYEPERGFAGHPWLLEVFRAPQAPITPVHDHHDIERLERVPDTL